jgi:hypothetical protein
MKRQLAVALALLLGLAATGPAKQPRAQKEMSGALGWFGPQVLFNDFKGINDELARAGIADRLSSLHWTFGGGGHAHIGRVVIGGSGWGGSQTVASESAVVRVEVSGGQFEAGYSVLALKHLVVTPMLGIGGSGYSISVERRLNLPGNFNEFLRNPGPSSSVSFDGFLLTPMLVVSIPVKFVGVQLRGGYQFVPTDPEWRFPNGTILPQGPQVSAGQPFAGLHVFLGGLDFSRPKKKKD